MFTSWPVTKRNCLWYLIKLMWHVSALYYWKSLSFYLLLSYLSRHFDICIPAYTRFSPANLRWLKCTWLLMTFFSFSTQADMRALKASRDILTNCHFAFGLLGPCLVDLFLSTRVFFSDCQHSACRIQKYMILNSSLQCQRDHRNVL